MTWTLFFTMWLVASVSATLGWVFRAGIENSRIQLEDEMTMNEKLLKDKAVEVMSRRIEALERDKRDLQELFSTQFDRSDEMARDHRRMKWLEGHPTMIDYFEGYWYHGDSIRFSSFREVIDAAMKESKGKT
jgi:hypothetical protein